MNIKKVQEDDKLTIILEGRLDTTTAPEFQDVLIPAFGEANEIVLDFSEVAYVSSAGLRVLLIGEKEAKVRGASMSLTAVSADVMEVFEMTGFSDMLSII